MFLLAAELLIMCHVSFWTGHVSIIVIMYAL